jgi:hypothetical protein
MDALKAISSSDALFEFVRYLIYLHFILITTRYLFINFGMERCVVFDNASPISTKLSFEKRYKKLMESTRVNHEFIVSQNDKKRI